MPFQPKGPCSYPGCNTLTIHGRCEKHRNTESETRKSSRERGYTSQWKRQRNAYIRANPVCEIREKCDGSPAAEVDHIRPIDQGGDLLDEDNLQSTCKPCHAWKTATVDKAPHRPSP